MPNRQAAATLEAKGIIKLKLFFFACRIVKKFCCVNSEMGPQGKRDRKRVGEKYINFSSDNNKQREQEKSFEIIILPALGTRLSIFLVYWIQYCILTVENWMIFLSFSSPPLKIAIFWLNIFPILLPSIFIEFDLKLKNPQRTQILVNVMFFILINFWFCCSSQFRKIWGKQSYSWKKYTLLITKLHANGYHSNEIKNQMKTLFPLKLCLWSISKKNRFVTQSIKNVLSYQNNLSN